MLDQTIGEILLQGPYFVLCRYLGPSRFNLEVSRKNSPSSPELDGSALVGAQAITNMTLIVSLIDL